MRSWITKQTFNQKFLSVNESQFYIMTFICNATLQMYYCVVLMCVFKCGRIYVCLYVIQHLSNNVNNFQPIMYCHIQIKVTNSLVHNYTIVWSPFGLHLCSMSTDLLQYCITMCQEDIDIVFKLLYTTFFSLAKLFSNQFRLLLKGN